MRGESEERAAAVRARWMSELAEAIEGAQRVAWQLGSGAAESGEARELYGQLEAARIELETLRGITRRPREDIDPWLVRHIGWPGSLDEPED